MIGWLERRETAQGQKDSVKNTREGGDSKLDSQRCNESEWDQFFPAARRERGRRSQESAIGVAQTGVSNSSRQSKSQHQHQHKAEVNTCPLGIVLISPLSLTIPLTLPSFLISAPPTLISQSLYLPSTPST